MNVCPECNKKMDEMCVDCGCFFDKPELVVTDLYNYQAKPLRFYNRLDHFKEVLGQFQGREGKHIPGEILEKIKNELPDSREATAEDIKKTIRKLKLTKYMENFYYILFAVTGRQPPYIPKEIENKIVRMFRQIDRVYGSVCHDSRKSFLNYYYILFKLLELRNETDLMGRVPLIRTVVRLRQHDLIWKRICEELGWTWKLTNLLYMRTSSKPRQGAYKNRAQLRTTVEDV